MNSDRAATDPVPSPCINVCSMDEGTGLCAGCHRTLDEIAQWSAYTPAQKRAVHERLRARRTVSRTA
ncbi:MAG: DUF1289 domain-containing protein [Burkholderiales bacterium]|nr:DUF1289 domain-containing protein [Burkholderiales bacterium]